jgi:hypothetical protein
LTLDPEHETLNPQPQTLDPKTQTLNPKPSTLNPQPSPSEDIHSALTFLSATARGAALSALPRAAAAAAVAALPFDDQLLTVLCLDAETGAHFLKTLAPNALAKVCLAE